MIDLVYLDDLAGQLYTTYCSSVGGLAHDGTFLPTWSEFVADKQKEKQANAWRDVASKAIDICNVDPDDTDRVEFLKRKVKEYEPA